MDSQKLYELTTKLFECSELMKELDMTCSNILLDMSSKTLELLEQSRIPEDIREEIVDIQNQILSGDDND